MKPEQMSEFHPEYQNYWMLRFLQDTPGLGYGIYRLCEIGEKCLRVHLEDDVELDKAVESPHPLNLDPAMARMTIEQFTEFDEDGDPTGGTKNFWKYTAITRSLNQRCQDVITKMEVAP